MGGRGASSISSYSDNNKQDRTLKQIIGKTQNLKNEQYRIIDENGDVLILAKGNQDSVSITVGQKRELMSGNISIHNHPDGGTFSPEDLRDFGFGAKSMVVTGKDGTYQLINKNFGKSTQYDGWLDMQRDIMSKIKEMDYWELRKQARQNLSNSKIKRQMDTIYKKFEKLNKTNKEKAQEYARNSGYNELRDKFEKSVRDETRRLEVKPYHDYYKKNASKYGFKYVYKVK